MLECGIQFSAKSEQGSLLSPSLFQHKQPPVEEYYGNTLCLTPNAQLIISQINLIIIVVILQRLVISLSVVSHL